MSHHVIEFDAVCKSCQGTGLYIGFAEHNGAAVVCHDCKGTGCYHTKIEYDDYDGKVARTDVKRVLRVNPGIGVGAGSGYHLEDFGGMRYKDWLAGKPFPPKSEMRRFVCPAWWYQSADYNKKPGWNECTRAGSFSRCPYFVTKEKCWERWDGEFGNKEAV